VVALGLHHRGGGVEYSHLVSEKNKAHRSGYENEAEDDKQDNKALEM
jgi:hypothetical protein